MQSKLSTTAIGASNLPGCLKQPGRLIKIGTVARDFEVSPDLLRLYEREGLLVPLKSAGGTRYFTRLDYPWIGMLMQLVRKGRLNLSGIRQLLGMITCWKQRDCPVELREKCPVMSSPELRPCWMTPGLHCCRNQSWRECYFCCVYRTASRSSSLRPILAAAGLEDEEFSQTVPGNQA